MFHKNSIMFNKNFILLLISNIIFGAPMPILILMGALAGNYLAPSESWATLPPAIQIFAGVVIAVPISNFMSKYGRKFGFLTGGALGIIGGILGAYSIIWHSFALLCLAHFCLGITIISIGFIGFAAAEATAEKHKASAIAYILASGLIAAIIAPEIFKNSRDLLTPLPFAGTYMVIGGISFVGNLVILWLKLPKINAVQKRNNFKHFLKMLTAIKRKPIGFAIFSATLSQTIMMLIMVPTPMAMLFCGFTEVQAGNVIRWHFIAMFAPGFFTGKLIQKFGNMKIIQLGFIALALAAITALMDIQLINFYLSLIFLGIGWNFGFIGATNMLQASVTPEERGTILGINTSLIALASTIATLLSGFLLNNLSWASLSIITLPVVAFGLIILFKYKKSSQ